MNDVSDSDVLAYWAIRISGADEAHEMLGDPGCPPELQCISHLAAEVRTQRETIRELQARVAELDSEVKRWEDLFAVTEEAAEDCRTGLPLLTHEEVFGVDPIPSDTDGLPKEEP